MVVGNLPNPIVLNHPNQSAKLSADVSGPILLTTDGSHVQSCPYKGFLPVYDVKAGCKVMRR